MHSPVSIESRAIGCLIGGACGDALGYPVEHKNLNIIRKKYGQEGIQEMELVEGVAKITDDTQMTIYTAQGLIHAVHKQCSYNEYVTEVHLSYLRWIASLLHNENDIINQYSRLYSEEQLKENDLLRDGKNAGLDVKMCRGGSTFSALLSGKFYTTTNPPPEGVRCGTIMRSAPIGILCRRNPEMAFKLGRDCAVLTHGDPSAYLSAGFMCMLIAYLLSENKLEDSISRCMEYLKTQDCSRPLYDVLLNGIERAMNPRERPIDDIQAIGLGWRADENLSICLYCLLRFKTNVKQAFIACVNHDGDSDSVGAVYGNLVGAYVGYDALPREYVDHVQFRDLLMQQAETLVNSNPPIYDCFF